MLATFYHSTTRNLVIAFGDLFNDIYVVRRNANGTENNRIKVPIEYSPKQKWWRMLKERDGQFKTVGAILPRISFEITSVSYDGSRKVSSVQQLFHESGGVTKQAFAPTPYIYTIELNIMVENSDDGFQILEQILPYFNPTFHVSALLVPTMGYHDDIAITLNSTSKVDDYEGEFEKIRVQTWTLSFGADMNIYGPVKDAKLIKKAIVDIHAVGGNGPVTLEEEAKTPRHVRITTEPDPLNALPTDDYGFTITIEEFDDGKKRNPVTGLDEEIV